jgi:hypothetical protein
MNWHLKFPVSPLADMVSSRRNMFAHSINKNAKTGKPILQTPMLPDQFHESIWQSTRRPS